MKKDKAMTIIGTVLMAGGIPVTLIWASMQAIGGMINAEMPPYFSAFTILGAIGSIVGMANGVMIVKDRPATKKVQIGLAAATAVFSLPGVVMFIQMAWYFAAVPVFLFGFGPSAYYLVRIYDAYSERKL